MPPNGGCNLLVYFQIGLYQCVSKGTTNGSEDKKSFCRPANVGHSFFLLLSVIPPLQKSLCGNEE